MPTIAGDCRINGGNESFGIGDDARSAEKSSKSSPMKRRSTSGSLISPPSPMKTKSPRRCLNSSPASCISATNASSVDGDKELFGIGGVRSEKTCKSTTAPMKRGTAARSLIYPPSPVKWKSPRRCLNSSPTSTCINSTNGTVKDSAGKLLKSHHSLVHKLSESFDAKLKWNPKVTEQMTAVKEALHVSMAPSNIVCREDEHNKVLDFCKMCVQQDKAGSLYVCGLPGTGKSLSVEKVKQLLLNWAGKEGFQLPDALSISCASLTNTSEIFGKILESRQSPQKKKKSGSISPLQSLKKMYSIKKQSSGMKMMLVIADELDYLITKDRAVLHDLFMLTTLPYSRCILIGIANAIDLADRFLPKLQSLNCKPTVITFRAYSKDQILKILQQRLMALPYDVFHPQALELCARKVAAASGDMRKALSVCRSAIEMLEAELKESVCHMDNESVEGLCEQRAIPKTQEIDTVRLDHMIAALSRTYKSPIVDTIQALPQHQQILLCSAVKLFRGGKKDTTIGELNKFYLEICKSLVIPPAGILELSSMCSVLSDQGLLKLGQSRQEKLKRVTLKVDEVDITFALQGIRLFRNCLQSDLW